jgi:hypothetical protein
MTKSEIDKVLNGINTNSMNRFQAFIDLIPMLNGENYWYALRNAYESSDNLYRHSQKVKESFLDSVPNRENLMSPSEINYLESLPDLIPKLQIRLESENHL